MTLDRTRHTRMTAVAAAIAGLILQAPGTALATPASPGWVTESPPAKAFFENIRIRSGDDDPGGNFVRLFAADPSDVYVVRNTVTPGSESGWHSHPGPSLVIVQAGTATVYEGDDASCTATTYAAGSGFIDAGGTHVHLVRNESGTDTLVTVAFQVIPHGVARRIDAPKPSQCP